MIIKLWRFWRSKTFGRRRRLLRVQCKGSIRIFFCFCSNTSYCVNVHYCADCVLIGTFPPNFLNSSIKIINYSCMSLFDHCQLIHYQMDCHCGGDVSREWLGSCLMEVKIARPKFRYITYNIFCLNKDGTD